MNRFEAALAGNKTLIIDGGLATQLEAQGHDIGTSLWSAALLLNDPQAIVDAHRAFLEAGAECIISASYQASRPGLMSLGLSSEESDQLIVESVNLAIRARAEYLEAHPDRDFTPLVAASIGPYGAALHDGSEYKGNYGVSAEILQKFHTQRMRLLDGSGADVLACETIPGHDEARVLGELLEAVKTPAWLSFSCRDDRLINDGTPLREVAAMFAEHPRILALGINCTSPELISPLITEIRAVAPDKAIIVYPNSGETYEVKTNTWLGTVSPVECEAAAAEWLGAGASLIGGCCRMGPQHIAAIRDALG